MYHGSGVPRVSLPAGSARGTLGVCESCGEPSPAPWVSRAPAASLRGAQTMTVAEEETSEGPQALQPPETRTLHPGRMLRP